MYFQDSFYTQSMQNRKVSLESVETATSSSSWKSGQKSDGQNSEGQKYKTELCRFWRNYDYCPFGFECSFAHGFEQMRNKNISSKFKTSACKNFQKSGYCRYGDRCQFSHIVEPQSTVFPAESKHKVFYQSSTIRYTELLEDITSLQDLETISNKLQRVKPTIFKLLSSSQDLFLS